jgi:hypothetical protein
MAVCIGAGIPGAVRAPAVTPLLWPAWLPLSGEAVADCYGLRGFLSIRCKMHVVGMTNRWIAFTIGLCKICFLLLFNLKLDLGVGGTAVLVLYGDRPRSADRDLRLRPSTTTPTPLGKGH